MEPIDIETKISEDKKEHFIDGFAYYMITEDILKKEEGEEEVNQLKLYLKTFTSPIFPELSEYFLPSINSFPANFYEENKIEITALYNLLSMSFGLFQCKKMIEDYPRLRMIADYVNYLLNEDILKTEDNKEIISDLFLEILKDNNGSDYIIRSINYFPDNFYEENREKIDTLYDKQKYVFSDIRLTKEIEKQKRLKEELERAKRRLRITEDRFLNKDKLEDETENIRKTILENERKKQLRNEVYKQLVDEGYIKRDFLDSDTRREPIPQDVMDKVWNRDSGRCVKCGSQENLEFDHIIPHSKGGATSYRNIQILCKKCNIEKSNKIG